MPENIRALIVVLGLALIVFVSIRKTSLHFISATDFNRRRNLWLATICLGYLSMSFWILAACLVSLLLITRNREKNAVALYFTLLLCIPTSKVSIPGLGIINYLIDLSFQRILVLAILLPLGLGMLASGKYRRFGSLLPDKLIIAYVSLIAILWIRETTITDVFRQVCYLLMDILIPYYVISRYLNSLERIREALLAFVTACFLLAMLAMFEFVKSWLLFESLTSALKIPSMAAYLGRSGMLRAITSAGHPIALGLTMCTAIGIYLYFQQMIPGKNQRRAGLLLLCGGLFASLSRGPWVGAVLMIGAYLFTGKNSAKNLTMMVMAGLLCLPLLTVVPGGERILNLLPFIGETEAENIDYRQRLLDNSIIVIKRNLLFGSTDYMTTPEMEAMRNGKGLIDIVNSYVRVALEAGIVGLGLFLGFFASIAKGIYTNVKKTSEDSELHQLGRCLFATLVGVLAIIFTVSSITFIPWIYWSLAGFGTAYNQLVARQSQEQMAPASTPFSKPTRTMGV